MELFLKLMMAKSKYTGQATTTIFGCVVGRLRSSKTGGQEASG